MQTELTTIQIDKTNNPLDPPSPLDPFSPLRPSIQSPQLSTIVHWNVSKIVEGCEWIGGIGCMKITNKLKQLTRLNKWYKKHTWESQAPASSRAWAPRPQPSSTQSPQTLQFLLPLNPPNPSNPLAGAWDPKVRSLGCLRFFSFFSLFRSVCVCKL